MGAFKMSEQMREEFEAAYFESCGFKPQNWNGVDYLHAHANGAWWAWQASRAALCVELPEEIVPNQCDHNEYWKKAGYYNEAIRDAREAIHAAGVKTK
jgi:hypothetical protein